MGISYILGGIHILEQLRKAEIPSSSIHNIFVTHNHIDHIIGIIWLIRKIALAMMSGEYKEDVHIYASNITIDAIRTIAKLTLNKRQSAYLDNKIQLISVKNRELVSILGENFIFYDVYAKKEVQYGFYLKTLSGQILVCNGDETLDYKNYDLVENADFLIHEAFCLDSEKEVKRPYEKGHTTAKDVCEMATKLNVKNLILYHIKDEDFNHRKDRYLKENTPYFSGNLYVPNDLDRISLECKVKKK